MEQRPVSLSSPVTKKGGLRLDAARSVPRRSAASWSYSRGNNTWPLNGLRPPRALQAPPPPGSGGKAAADGAKRRSRRRRNLAARCRRWRAAQDIFAESIPA
ncbi:hypothetical protein PR202_ga11241 [Eleusine coracana subsp. coracana]|uniref:Uncharacterized protein n=1 Tax=Eleusine coracana subsp. coracana TaxID=191504 RepID=A0AAV5C8T1_ELECO|nr:hypothetical protein PR202_ga11241 [Eleusine coracana subsp. coracana]